MRRTPLVTTLKDISSVVESKFIRAVGILNTIRFKSAGPADQS